MGANDYTISINVDAEFNIYVTEHKLDAKAEAHALMTLNAYVVDRMRELYSAIADRSAQAKECPTL
jgi:hypothetical protein